MLRCFVFMEKSWIFVEDSFVFHENEPSQSLRADSLPLSGEVASRSDDGEGLLPQNPMKKYTQIA